MSSVPSTNDPSNTNDSDGPGQPRRHTYEKSLLVKWWVLA